MVQSISSIFGLDNFSLGLGTLGNILLLVIGSTIIVSAIAGVIIWWVYRKTFNQQAVIWGRINGVPQEIATFKAKWRKIGIAGDRLFFIAGLKKYEYPKLLTGRNKYHFWRREKDNELINFEFEDMDERFRVMKVKFIDTDVRMQRLGIAKNLEKRLQNKKDWMQIITTIAYIVVFILIFISLVVLFSKLIDVAEALNNMAGSVGRVAGEIQKLAEGTGVITPDNKPPTDTGLIPVPEPTPTG